MLTGLITEATPPPNRAGHCTGGIERHLTEGAVMIAYAQHLLRTTAARRVAIHPDGEHGKRFAFRAWLESQGFDLTVGFGKTDYGGLYRNGTGREIEVNPRSGRGDISAIIGDERILAEAKGGILNTRHPGQTSRLRKGLCEAVGLLLATPLVPGLRQVAVVPRVDVTERLAERMLPRCHSAGIGIALVDGEGKVTELG